MSSQEPLLRRLARYKDHSSQFSLPGEPSSFSVLREREAASPRFIPETVTLTSLVHAFGGDPSRCMEWRWADTVELQHADTAPSFGS